MPESVREYRYPPLDFLNHTEQGQVSLREILESAVMADNESPVLAALGRDASGAPAAMDIASMPHVLIAGDEARGSDVSAFINTIVCSILMRSSPQEVRLILADLKLGAELGVYNGIPHLLTPVITDPRKALAAFSWAKREMDRRYERFRALRVRDIKGFNNAAGLCEEKMSRIIVVIDELAYLMMNTPGETEDSLCSLAQRGRAAGVHLIVATQRPSVHVITGIVKANISSRIAFAVSSLALSRIILDSAGAEKLLGKGDMLYAPLGTLKPTRIQGCPVSEDEVQRIVNFIRCNHQAEYSGDVIGQHKAAEQEAKSAAGEEISRAEPMHELLIKAIECAVEEGEVSINMLHRRLPVGYVRADRLINEMERLGIVGEAEIPYKPRTVLISREEWRRMQENQK